MSVHITDEEWQAMQNKLQTLTDALEPFAKIADEYPTWEDRDYISIYHYDIRLSHMRKAREAINMKSPP